MTGKKNRNINIFDSTSDVQIIGTKELGNMLGKEKDLNIKPDDKDSSKIPDR